MQLMMLGGEALILELYLWLLVELVKGHMVAGAWLLGL